MAIKKKSKKSKNVKAKSAVKVKAGVKTKPIAKAKPPAKDGPVRQGSNQKRPTVVSSKPANESGLGLGFFTPSPPEEASLFSCANSVDRI